MFCNFLDCSHVVCLYQKSVCKVYQTCLQSSATGFLLPDQRNFLSLYSHSLLYIKETKVYTTLTTPRSSIDHVFASKKVKYTLHYTKIFYWSFFTSKKVKYTQHYTQIFYWSSLNRKQSAVPALPRNKWKVIRIMLRNWLMYYLTHEGVTPQLKKY